MKRLLIFMYGIAAYAVMLVALVYSIGFIGNIAVPKSMDSAPTASFAMSLAIDLALLSLFAVQHSVMARPGFKRWFTRFVPPAAERSTYVLLSTLCLGLLMWQWAPLGGVIWNATTHWAALTLTALYFMSWALLLYATFALDHFDLFGLRQVFNALKKKPVPEQQFRTPTLYRIVRHPIYLGWLGIFWITPTMTVTHLIFAAATTIYILIAICFEEKDLEAFHPEYAQYKRKVPSLVPSIRRRLARDARMNSA